VPVYPLSEARVRRYTCQSNATLLLSKMRIGSKLALAIEIQTPSYRDLLFADSRNVVRNTATYFDKV